MKRQEKMDPAQRDAYQTLLKELENLGEEATPTRQILQLALQLDEKESSTNLQKYSGIAEQMVKMSSDCPEITKMILDIIYGDEGEGNRN